MSYNDESQLRCRWLVVIETRHCNTLCRKKTRCSDFYGKLLRHLQLKYLVHTSLCDPVYDNTLECTNKAERLEIIEAIYTRRNFHDCYSVPSAEKSSRCGVDGSKGVDMTKKLYKLCNNRIKCQFNPKTYMTADPCPNVQKYFAIRYRCKPRA